MYKYRPARPATEKAHLAQKIVKFGNFSVLQAFLVLISTPGIAGPVCGGAGGRLSKAEEMKATCCMLQSGTVFNKIIDEGSRWILVLVVRRPYARATASAPSDVQWATARLQAN
jgi:hypothetical protein